MTALAADLDAALARASAAVSEAALREALGVLMSTASPPGGERALAEHLVEWGRRAYPGLSWEAEPLDKRSANVVVRSVRGDAARELGLYGHLDTSLSGDAAVDHPITGAPADPPPFRFDASTRSFRGLGVGVAKAPAAGAIVALARASAALGEMDVPHRLTLLLAAGGTHRAAPREGDDPAGFGRGVSHALAGGWRPSAILNVKGGPHGVLHEEPSAAYLRVRVRAPWSAALSRRLTAPAGGLARHLGIMLDAIESWRERYLGEHPPAGQLACEIAIGAVRGGAPDKPDLLPGLVEVFVYAVLPPEEDPRRIAAAMASAVRAAVAALPDRPAVDVDVYAFGRGGRTDPSSEVVRLARGAWASRSGDTAAVTGWTGATDGGVFQAAGIPTARLGATVSRDAADPRIEIVGLDELVLVARAHLEVAIRYFSDRPAA